VGERKSWYGASIAVCRRGRLARLRPEDEVMIFQLDG